jgi:hypothetical protein
MSCGLDCFGQDINPLGILVSKAKTELGWTDDDLLLAFNRVVAEANADNGNEIVISFSNMEKWFRSDVSLELSKLRRAIVRQDDLRIRRILWVILAETIRRTSNDRTTTYKLHARPFDEIQNRALSAIHVFEGLGKQSVEDVIKFKQSLRLNGLIQGDQYIHRAELVLGNTTQTIISPTTVGIEKFNLLVTSPPYGDNLSTITYGQHAYLPLQWIEMADIDPRAEGSFLCSTHEIDRRSLGGHISRKLDDLTKQLELQSDILAEVFRFLSKSAQPKDRTARVASFYEDFIIAIDRILLSMADNSYLVWTVGNRRVGGMEIPNDQILTQLFANRHTVLVADINRSIHFKRMPHKNKIAQTMRAEKILIFRKQPNVRVTNE